jgi:hypothetical protein
MSHTHTHITPIVSENTVGIDVEGVVQIVVNTAEQTITEEIEGVPVATQSLGWWSRIFLSCFSSCFKKST